MADETANIQLTFNGIDGASGDYLLPPMSPADISRIAQGEKLDEAHLRELKIWFQRTTEATLGPKEGVDPKKIEETGWGVIFAFEDMDKVPAVKEALSELLNHRQAQANRLAAALPRVQRPGGLPARTSPSPPFWPATA